MAAVAEWWQLCRFSENIQEVVEDMLDAGWNWRASLDVMVTVQRWIT